MSTLDSVRAHIVALLDLSHDVAIEAETDLRSDLGIESMDALTLITDLEAEFSITVEDHQLLALQTVGDVVRLVDELRERGNTLANPAGAE